MAKTELKPIDQFVHECGHFYNANENGININNGYNCNHKNCGEIEDGVGKCYSWCCPLAYEADEEDCEKFDVEFEEGEYMVVSYDDNENIIPLEGAE